MAKEHSFTRTGALLTAWALSVYGLYKLYLKEFDPIGQDYLPEKVGFDIIRWEDGKYLKPRSFKSNHWPNIYRWRKPLIKSSLKYGFKPTLSASIAWVEEKAGDPYAISKSGAVGILQVMPRDGIASKFRNKKGEPLFADRPTTRQLQDPEFNIDYGLKLLKGRFDHYGTIENALWAYGPKDTGYDYAEMVLWLQNKIS